MAGRLALAMDTIPMTEQHFSTEKRILMVMRKTLAKVIRDITPSDAAVKYPLSDETVEDIKVCFDLITARERELAQQAGVDIQDKPRFIDQPKTSHPVSVQGIKPGRDIS